MKLWLGVSPERSGVFSAGNGPAMRSPIIGVWCADDLETLIQLVRCSSRITHTDPKAEFGALAVAIAANLSASGCPTDLLAGELLKALEAALSSDAAEFLTLVKGAVASVEAGQSTIEYADSLGLSSSVGGYIYHTVPVVLHSWMRNPEDYQHAVLDVIQCGGDTDTLGSIAGAIVGSRVGQEGIPQEWLAGLAEWPRGAKWIEGLGKYLAKADPTGYGSPWLAPPILVRNLVFLIIVLFHGFRRMLPPY